MLDSPDLRTDLPTRIAWGIAIAWCLGVGASFFAANVLHAGFGSGFAANLYAPLAILPTLLLGALAIRCYGLGTRFGRAILLTVAGTLAWTIADLYYSVAKVDQFASVADAGYLLGPALWGAALLLLWRAAGIGWRDAVAHWWLLAATVAVLTVAAMPPAAEVAGVPLGGDMLRLGDVSWGDAALSIAYLAVDALLLLAAVVLWRRSFGFVPYRLIVLASATLCAADLLYTNRFATGAYDPVADPSDLLYAAAIGLLMFALAAFEGRGRSEHRLRHAILRLVREQRGPHDAETVAT